MPRGCVILRVALFALFAACSSEPSPPSPDAAPATAVASGLPDRDPALAHRLVEGGALLLDVRSAEEFAEGHIEGAVNIPHTEIDGRLAEIESLVDGDPSKPIVVYCRSGRRSGIAKQGLSAHGYRQITNLGGMTAW